MFELLESRPGLHAIIVEPDGVRCRWMNARHAIAAMVDTKVIGRLKRHAA
jgi:hypothetical protein